MFNSIRNIEAGVNYYTHLGNRASKKHSDWDKLSNSEKQAIVVACYNQGVTGFFTNCKGDMSNLPYLTRDYISEVAKLEI